MEHIAYLGLPHCVRLANETVDVVVTTDVGPRILRYGFVGDDNVLGEVPDAKVDTVLGSWRPLGGHRLWAAPEVRPWTYAPDDRPVELERADERSIRVRAPVEEPTGLQKQITVTLGAGGTRVRIVHAITNRGSDPKTLAPWAITILASGGEVILPQEPYRTWDEELAPARPLVLWHYTDLRDPRFEFGTRLVRLRADATRPTPQKIGVLDKQGWAAYLRGDTVFVKTVRWIPELPYPDYGCNAETYTAGDYLELETLGPLEHLPPGASATHVEEWLLFRGVGRSAGEDDLCRVLAPLLETALGMRP